MKKRTIVQRIVSFSMQKLAPYITSDELFLKIKFWSRTGYRLNLKNPQTFNEKLQWLKLYNRKDEYTQMVDKIEVKRYIANMIGEEYIIPTLAIYNSPDEINFDLLPNQFVIKCSHDSGGLIICQDKSKLDRLNAIQKLEQGLHRNYFCYNREWPYLNVKPRLLAEQFMQQEDGSGLIDYKVLCFNGKAKLIEVHIGRGTDHHTQDYYDRTWNKTSISQSIYGLCSNITIPKPICYDEMLDKSELISKDIPQCRVDWYIVNNHLYFGEITFYDGSGMDPYDRLEDDLLLGSWINLPSKETKV